VTATATDSAGNSATSGVTSFSIDTVAPAVAITSPADGASLNATTAPGGNVVFAGTTELGATVVVTVDGAPHVATVVGTSWTVTVALIDGPHAVTATAADAAGNSAGTSISFSLDTGLPVAIFTAPVDGATLDAAAAPGGSVLITGLTNVGDTVTVSVDGTDYAATVVGTTWSVTVTLSDGPHAATATATDGVGNTASASITFSLDTAAPVVAIATPVDGATLNATAAPGGSVALDGTTEAGATVVVTVDGTPHAATVTGTDWTVTVTLADGAHTATATATDAAGNPATSSAVGFTLDTVAPTVAITIPVDGATLDVAGGSVTLTGTTEAGATVVVTVDGTPHAATVTGTDWTVTVTVTDGAHSATATATDAAGNAGVSSTVAFSTATASPGGPEAHVSGGGGCSCGPSGGVSPSALLLLVPALAFVPRRRRGRTA